MNAYYNIIPDSIYLPTSSSKKSSTDRGSVPSLTTTNDFIPIIDILQRITLFSFKANVSPTVNQNNRNRYEKQNM